MDEFEPEDPMTAQWSVNGIKSSLPCWRVKRAKAQLMQQHRGTETNLRREAVLRERRGGGEAVLRGRLPMLTLCNQALCYHAAATFFLCRCHDTDTRVHLNVLLLA